MVQLTPITHGTIIRDGFVTIYTSSFTHLSNGNVLEWFNKFETCCKVNNWNDDTKAIKLPTLMEDEALEIWLKLRK